MLTALKLREENIAEYLLYMWQVEDLLRACGLDMECVERQIVDRYPVDEAAKREIGRWYEDLIGMMRMEGVTEKGHLQICGNVLIQLSDLHRMLLRSAKYPEYGAEFYRTLPIIVELRSKSGGEKPGEIEACFNALYGMLLMRLRRQPVSEETQKAMAQVSKFVSMLSSYYHKDKRHPIFDKDDYE